MRFHAIRGRHLFAAGALFALAACGHGPLLTCKDPCKDPKLERDAFCNCVPKATDKPTPGTGGGTGAGADTLSSACICVWPNDQFQAWFRLEPPNFANLRGKTVKIAAFSCEDIKVCPFIGPQKEQRFVHNDVISLKVEEASIIENFITGKKSFTLFGAGVPKVADAEPPEQRVAPALVGLNASLDFVAFPAAPEAEGGQVTSSCLTQCPSGVTNAVCSVGKMTSTIQGALGKLLARARAPGETTIHPADMQSLFKLASDPCSRGPSAISAAGVFNVGPPCSIEATAADLGVTLRIDVPARLVASWETRDAFPMKVRFDAVEDAPTVSFLQSATGKPSPLNADFGGIVSAAEADQNRFFFRTPGGCVGVGIQSPAP